MVSFELAERRIRTANAVLQMRMTITIPLEVVAATAADPSADVTTMNLRAAATRSLRMRNCAERSST
jgi:hypothetical protein